MGTSKLLVTVMALVAMPFFAAPAVGAVEDCTISNTGPGSTNTCENVSDYTCEVTANNEVVIYNQNNQNAVAGSGTVEDNTQGGGAYSGTVTNSNGTQFGVTITNESCEVTTVTVPTEPEVPVETPEPEVVTPEVTSKPTVLANTSGDKTIETVAAVLAGSAVVSALAYAASTLYRRSHQ